MPPNTAAPAAHSRPAGRQGAAAKPGQGGVRGGGAREPGNGRTRGCGTEQTNAAIGCIAGQGASSKGGAAGADKLFHLRDSPLDVESLDLGHLGHLRVFPKRHAGVVDILDARKRGDEWLQPVLVKMHFLPAQILEPFLGVVPLLLQGFLGAFEGLLGLFVAPLRLVEITLRGHTSGDAGTTGYERRASEQQQGQCHV